MTFNWPIPNSLRFSQNIQLKPLLTAKEKGKTENWHRMKDETLVPPTHALYIVRKKKVMLNDKAKSYGRGCRTYKYNRKLKEMATIHTY